jgi:hypothetical protein
MFGKTMSQTSREKMSLAKTKISEETRKKYSESHKGKIISEETKQKMREGHKRRRELKLALLSNNVNSKP